MNHYVREKKKLVVLRWNIVNQCTLAPLYIYFEYRKYRDSLEVARQPITCGESCGGNKTRIANLFFGDSEILDSESSHAV